MSDVTTFGNITRLNLPTDRVLEAAKGHCSKGVVVLGFDDDGEMYFASSVADGRDVLWLLALAERTLLEVGD